MNLAVLFSPWSLSFRGTLDLSSDIYDDPKGMTGSEIGFLRTAECLAELGHDVTAFTVSPECERNGVKVRPWSNEYKSGFDAVVSINEPNLLFGCSGFRVCSFWLNKFDFCRKDAEKQVDLFMSPSEPHLEKLFSDPTWQRTNVGPGNQQGDKMELSRDNWIVNRLGCDPDRYDLSIEKVPGRCIYCSSPDRGLHILLQEWPKIKAAVPHAHLKIFYRLEPFLRSFDTTPYFPAIEENRSRAIYIEEALRRLQGYDIEVCDSVSRNQLAREMCEAECLAYPCDTLSWSEGFSCSILESLAAKACPVITNCDALGGVYGESGAMINRRETPIGDWFNFWGEDVRRLLVSDEIKKELSERGRTFAEQHTWAAHAKRLAEEVEKRI